MIRLSVKSLTIHAKKPFKLANILLISSYIISSFYKAKFRIVETKLQAFISRGLKV